MTENFHPKIDFSKEKIPGDETDMSLAYVGFKTHNERTEASNTFLAFRCKDASDPAACPTLPFKSLKADAVGADLEATWDDAAGEYTVGDPPDGGHQVGGCCLIEFLTTFSLAS